MACHRKGVDVLYFLVRSPQKNNRTRDGINLKVHFFYLVTFGANAGSVKIGLKDEEELEKEAVEGDCGGICWSHLNPWDRLYF